MVQAVAYDGIANRLYIRVRYIILASEQGSVEVMKNSSVWTIPYSEFFRANDLWVLKTWKAIPSSLLLSRQNLFLSLFSASRFVEAHRKFSWLSSTNPMFVCSPTIKMNSRRHCIKNECYMYVHVFNSYALLRLHRVDLTSGFEFWAYRFTAPHVHQLEL